MFLSIGCPGSQGWLTPYCPSCHCSALTGSGQVNPRLTPSCLLTQGSPQCPRGCAALISTELHPSAVLRTPLHGPTCPSSWSPHEKALSPPSSGEPSSEFGFLWDPVGSWDFCRVSLRPCAQAGEGRGPGHRTGTQVPVSAVLLHSPGTLDSSRGACLGFPSDDDTGRTGAVRKEALIRNPGPSM